MHEKREWETTGMHYGVGHHDGDKARETKDQRCAGLTRAQCSYWQSHDFPRFERQKMRALADDNILTGAKRPHPEMLRRVANRDGFPEKPPTGDSGHDLRRTGGKPAGLPFGQPPPTGGSGRSRHSSTGSCRSRNSQVSRRSEMSMAGMSIASSRASRASSGPPPGYYRQGNLEEPPSAAYKTTSKQYGCGGNIGREPVPGREDWMLGRGGGQISSWENCLYDNAKNIPLIK